MNLIKTVNPSWTANTWIVDATGALQSNHSGYYVSDFIPVTGGITLYSNLTINGIFTYDSNKTYINRISSAATTHVISSNAAYIRIEANTNAHSSYSEYVNNLILTDFPNASSVTGVNNVITSSSSVNVQQNHSLFARWIYPDRTVTFNANGGTVSPTSKTVNKGFTYGTLPTPEKSGYTFAGWMGKNILKANVSSSTPSNTSSDSSTKRTFTPNTYVVGLAGNNYYYSSRVSNVSVGVGTLTFTSRVGYGVAFPLQIPAGQTLTLSYNISGTSPYNSIMYYKSDGTLLNYTVSSSTGNVTRTFTTPANTYYVVIMFGCNYDSDKVINVSNIQLEYGDTATSYEQYLGSVTSNTTVSIDENHTLVAKWN